MGAGVIGLGRIVLLIGEHSVEEGDDLRVAVSWNRIWVGVERVRWVIEAGERVVVHVVEPLVVTSDPGV